MLPAQLLSVLHYPLFMPYPPFSWGGFGSLKADPPAPSNPRFPERTRVALRSDLAHDNHQNSNFLFRLR